VRVEVRSGPFQGLQGVVEGRCANGRLVLQVETLGRAVSLEIDGALLDVLE
jgi:transcription antitermination factor NusG